MYSAEVGVLSVSAWLVDTAIVCVWLLTLSSPQRHCGLLFKSPAIGHVLVALYVSVGPSLTRCTNAHCSASS